MKKYFGILILCIAGISLAAASDLTATIMEVAGKVECKLPGKDWKTAKTGDVLPAGSSISTGFKSTAILKMEAATLTVKPVTRLSLEELVKSEGTTKTQMFLMAGRVKAEVTPPEGEKAEFKVKSPTATASVRGTGFEFDGQNLVVDHGTVQLEAESGVGIPQSVGGGQFSTLSQTGTVTAPIAVTTASASSSAISDSRESASNTSAANSSVIDTTSTTSDVTRPDLKPDPVEPNPPTPDNPEPPKPEEPKTRDVTISVGWED